MSQQNWMNDFPRQPETETLISKTVEPSVCQVFITRIEDDQVVLNPNRDQQEVKEAPVACSRQCNLQSESPIWLN